MPHPNLHTLGTRQSRRPRQSCQTRAGYFLRYASWMARHILVRFCSVDYLCFFEMCSDDPAGSATLPLGLLSPRCILRQVEIIYGRCGSTPHKTDKISYQISSPMGAWSWPATACMVASRVDGLATSLCHDADLPLGS